MGLKVDAYPNLDMRAAFTSGFRVRSEGCRGYRACESSQTRYEVPLRAPDIRVTIRAPIIAIVAIVFVQT
jgi:hypothetical protein